MDQVEENQDWYVNIQEKVFGPVPFSTLQHWAATGSITAEAQVGTSVNGPWRGAAAFPSLELHWQVIDPSGEAFYGCHILALRHEVASDAIGPDWSVEHIPTGERYNVVDALCSALIDQNRILEERLTEAVDQIAKMNEASLEAQNLSEEPGTENLLEKWRALVHDRDLQMREAAKWQRFYDDEVARNGTREQELQAQIDELHAWQRKGSERIKALERRRSQLENLIQQNRASATGEGEDETDLMLAYQDLRTNFDRLAESLELRTSQLEDARAQVRAVEDQSRKEVTLLRNTVEEERETADDSLKQLGRLELAHRDLIRSHRDLNDRMIRLRNQLDAPMRAQLTKGQQPKEAELEAEQPAEASPQQPLNLPPKRRAGRVSLS